MATPAAHHRLDARGTRDQSRAFHLSRIFGGIRAAWSLVSSMKPISPGIYRISPAVVLNARERLEIALPYLTDDEGIVRL